MALDPLPDGVGGEAMLGLVSLLREDFMRNFVDKMGIRLLLLRGAGGAMGSKQ